MGIKAKFSVRDVRKITEDFYNNALISVSKALYRAAQEVVNDAKNRDTYADQTGNLRSSIGFVIFFNGVEIESSSFGGGALFPNKDGVKGSGADGINKGKEFARAVASKYTRGFVVVVVAGMEYAAYVEAKGYDVITGSTLLLAPYFERELKTISHASGINFDRQKI